jgi:hypothetical protein
MWNNSEAVDDVIVDRVARASGGQIDALVPRLEQRHERCKRNRERRLERM